MLTQNDGEIIRAFHGSVEEALDRCRYPDKVTQDLISNIMLSGIFDRVLSNQIENTDDGAEERI